MRVFVVQIQWIRYHLPREVMKRINISQKRRELKTLQWTIQNSPSKISINTCWRCVKTISLSPGAVNPVTLTKKTKEHNDYLIKTDDTQRHEDGSPNYNYNEEIIQMAQRHTTNSFMKLILKICSLSNHSLTKQRTSSVGLLVGGAVPNTQIFFVLRFSWNFRTSLG
jgi:hypothetical protein